MKSTPQQVSGAGKTSEQKPEFADNRMLTVGEALNRHLEWLAATQRDSPEVSIASGYFDPPGFAIIARQLEQLPRVRLLLGAEPLPYSGRERQKLGTTAEDYRREEIARSLVAHSNSIAGDRDLLGFTQETDSTIKKLLGYLKSGRIEVRRYEKGFLHGKAYIFNHGTGEPEGYLVGSSNLTAAGLTRNVELNVGRYDSSPVQNVIDWFNSLWNESQQFDIASYYEARFQEYTPWQIYLRVLLERFGGDLDGNAREGEIRLTSFQRDGLSRAQRILDKYNGVIFADGVGLGKTFIGGEMIRAARKERRQRAILICPASLRDGTWSRFQAMHDFRFETISYEELVQWDKGEKALDADPAEYALVVVDEAHAFRNPDTDRARALRKLLRGSPAKKLILMSATPVNNSLWDIYYLITFFAQHDAVFADRGVQSLKGKFEDAMREDPNLLKPDALFDILDATTVRRTRNFIKKAYPHERIALVDGSTIEIKFPKPKVISKTYDFEERLPGFFHEFAEALQPAEGDPKLTMARYAPSNFLTRRTRKSMGDEIRTQLIREQALVGLLRSGLLKRLESSAYSFRLTLQRMISDHQRFLEAMELGFVPSTSAIDELRETDNDEALNEIFDEEDVRDLISRTDSKPTQLYNISELKAAVRNDLGLLMRFHDQAARVSLANDPKLARLKETLLEISNQADADGRTSAEKRDNRKVIIFSYFADTIEWIASFLTKVFDTDRDLSIYRNRLIRVSGDEGNRLSAVFGFAPRTAEAPKGRDSDLYDILLTTDILAEGQNLQQARNIINYDLPWNPMRLVQRHGRIDRLGSQHKTVFVWCFFPDAQLEAMLLLEERIRRKLAQAAASIGVEGEVIPRSPTSNVVYADEEQDIHRIRSGNADIFENAGEDVNAHSGEEYRRDLQVAFQDRTLRRTIETLPFAVGSGMRSSEPGYFFCIRVGDGGDARVLLRFVSENNQVVRDTLQCLRRITCRPDTPRYFDDSTMISVYKAWQLAQSDILDEWTRATDPKTLTPKIPLSLRLAGEHLGKHRPPEVTQEELDRGRESIEAPWGVRIQRQFHAILNESRASNIEKSKKLLALITALGLQPYKAPEPLPPIQPEDIRAICWMALSAESAK